MATIAIHDLATRVTLDRASMRAVRETMPKGSLAVM